MDFYDKVKEFHEVFNHPVTGKPTLFPSGDVESDTRLANLRVNLIKEELGELCDALEAEDVVEVADALGDILVVTLGAALVWGIPIKDVFDEIHRANMSKLDPETGKPIFREDGKIMKGSAYAPPDVKSIIEAARG